MNEPRVALVHDWFCDPGGAEKVVGQIISMYPRCEVFSLIDFLPKSHRAFLAGKAVRTSFLQRIPFIKRIYRRVLPLMTFAVEQFDFAEFDLVISSSSSVAKGVITGPDQLHICYCHSPARYAWDLQQRYLEDAGLERGPLSLMVRALLYRFRIWDVRSSMSVDYFVANSEFIRRRIHKFYRRDATVIYPNVNVAAFDVCADKKDFYLTASRLVPYKKIGVIVDAFTNMPSRRLMVIGDGPELKKIRNAATPNIDVLGFQDFETLRRLMSTARGFIFAAEEDFGILPVEAQACGTPVIAFGKGGSLETVVKGVTGDFFYSQSSDEIVEAIEKFEEADGWSATEIRENADRFSTAKFETDFRAFVDEKLEIHFGDKFSR